MPHRPRPAVAALDINKYKIKKEAEENHLSAVPDERPRSQSEMTEKEKMLGDLEQKLLLSPHSQSDHDLEDDTSDDNFKERMSSESSSSSNDSMHKSPLSSMNDLDKSRSATSRDSLKLSTPNIRFKSQISADGASPSEGCAQKDPNLLQSMPELSDLSPDLEEKRRSEARAVEKLKKALHASDEGLISLYQGKKTVNRLSKDTEDALDRHRYRLTSSDC